METTYKMDGTESRMWSQSMPGWKATIRANARRKAAKDKASVVTIETPSGLIVDTLEVEP